MAVPPSERRQIAERRVLPNRRSGLDRRVGERRLAVVPGDVELRHGVERRQGAERRSVVERRRWVDRRVAQETVDEHIRNALRLLANVVDSGSLDDEVRHDLDRALFRLRFALNKLEGGNG